MHLIDTTTYTLMPPAAPLPAWARLTRPSRNKHDDDDDVNVAVEDAYLRTKVYHAGARAVDRAWQRALERQLRTKEEEENDEHATTQQESPARGQRRKPSEQPRRRDP